MVCLMSIESMVFRGQTCLTLGNLFLPYLFWGPVLAELVNIGLTKNIKRSVHFKWSKNCNVGGFFYYLFVCTSTFLSSPPPPTAYKKNMFIQVSILLLN